ncbi:MAG: murein biosynthesis integral membrane protein MurJ [Candidatus Omnitrophota bacterium]|nr:MAG: murein biosynthesis integral membrane protein MurJ [Candidatus Omnitrophota bacterium]
MDENKSLIKSTRAISEATFASRILGFIRDVIIARLFGTGVRAQAFVVAFRIPNLLRSLVGEGATNSAVVPVLARLNERGKREEFWQVANCLLNILIVVLAVLTLLGELLAPIIVRAIAPGFMKDPQKLYLTIRLTRFLFPYILLVGLSAYAMAVLNSLKSFALPALAPSMLNIALITSALIFCPRLKEPVDALGIGVLSGGVLQLAVQVPLLLKKGLLKKRSFSFFHPALLNTTPYIGDVGEGNKKKGGVHPRVKEMGRLFLPRTLGIAIYQINLFVDTIFASLTFIVGEGAPAAFQYANRLVQFPLALFGIALAQAALPAMSGLAARKDFAQMRRTLSFSLRSVFTMMLPATVGLMVLARPLVKVIFERGTFSSYSTNITSFVLLFYCLGLTGYAGIKVLASYFYSLKDTFTPSKAAAIALLINVILNFLLMRPLKMGGLALATAISVTINFGWLLFAMRKRIGKIEGLFAALGRIVLAASIMGAALWFGLYRSGFLWGSGLMLAFKLCASIALGVLVYSGALKLLSPSEAGIFIRWILRRK